MNKKMLFYSSSKEINDTTVLNKRERFDGIITADKASDFIKSIYFPQMNKDISLGVIIT